MKVPGKWGKASIAERIFQPFMERAAKAISDAEIATEFATNSA
jgi:hypothetical protein